MAIPSNSVTAGTRHTTVRLLLIEPENSEIRLRESIDPLVTEGFRVHAEFTSVAEAATTLERETADLVLVDIGGMDVTGLNELAAQPALQGYTPFIVIDHSTREEIAKLSLHIGAQDYLIKTKLSPARIQRSMLWSLERARIERELKAESDLFRALLVYIPDKIYFKDRHGRFLRASASVARWLNVPDESAILGKSDFNFYLPEHAEATFEDEQRIMRTGEPIVGKIKERMLPDGRREWSSTTKLPLRDRQGRIIGTYGITRDVSELKKLEATLAMERNLLRDLIDNLPDPICVKDLEGRHLLDNEAHVRFVGAHSKEDVLGRKLYEFIDSPSSRAAHAIDEEVMRTGEPWLNREEEIRTDERTMWLVTSKVPLRDDKGKISGIVCINRDITVRKQAQNELIEANTNLQAAMADLKKAHQQLHAVQLQLIEAEKLKSIGRLAAGVAHEVKNPLAIISMGIEFLTAQYRDDPTTTSVLGDLTAAVERADNVIKGLLDFSAPRRLELSAQDLNTIIRSALGLVRGEIHSDIHKIELQLGEIPPLEIDGGKISQVFVNLFTNALHAMAEGGTLTVRTRFEQVTRGSAYASDIFHPGDKVVIAEVQDTGTGIPQEILPRIFEPFVTTKPSTKGTGLGMSVVHSIMNLQGGLITMCNAPEGGALATLTFRASSQPIP